LDGGTVMVKVAIVFFGLLIVGGLLFQEDIADFARQLAQGKGAGYGTSSSGTGMSGFGNAVGNKFKSFGEGLK